MSILRQKKIILTAIIPLFLIIGLSIQSYAANVAIATQSVTGLGGATYTVDANAFTVTAPAYSVTRTGSTSATALAWSNTTPLQDTVTGNWQLQVTVTIPAAGVSARNYIAECRIDSGLGYPTEATSSITFATVAAVTTEPTSPASSGSATFIFDTGVQQINYITAIVITIKPAA